ncbi:MAG: LLM class F420-dependent oxidoreductase, partial [Actinomycetota bacterium]|nr:LLM class F420-dependent oxidoreductase [Actinomycetota bacterium]
GDLNAMSKRGEWQAMGELIDDEMLDTFAVVAEPDKVAAGIRARYGDCVDRMTFYALGGDHGADFWTPIVADLAA